MNSKIIETASVVGNDWVAGRYYDDAEVAMEHQWSNLIWPIIRDSDFSSTLELAAGHGRNTAKLLAHAAHVTAVDINQTNIDFLNQRFSGESKLTTVRNTGADFRFLEGASVTFAYCFDAMVHFDSDVVRSYIREFRRVMKPGARGFIHHSNYDKNPTGTYRDHPGWRNFMSKALFQHWLAKEGFRLLRSEYVVANSDIVENGGDADVVSFFELPNEAEKGGGFDDKPDRTEELEAKLVESADLAEELRQELRRSDELRHAMVESTSWRVTSPLRQLATIFKPSKAKR